MKVGLDSLDDKIGWIAVIIAPIFTGLVAWYVRLVDRIKKEDMDKIFEAINTKASDERLKSLENKVNDHKEANDSKYDQLYEMIESIDSKLDILIGKK